MTVDVINAIALILFGGGLVIATVLTGSRVLYYRRHGWRHPRLLWRDLLVIGGMAIAFSLILLARALDLDDLRETVFWALITDIPAVLAVIVYLYYEIFVIERGN